MFIKTPSLNKRFYWNWVASNFREFTKPIRAKVTIGHSNLTTTDANM